MSNIFGSPKRFREDDWFHKRDEPAHRLIDDLKFRADRLFDDDSAFKKSSFASSSSSSSQHSSRHSSSTTTNDQSTFKNGGNTTTTKNGSNSMDDKEEEKEIFDERDQFVIKVDVAKFPAEQVRVKVSNNNTLLIDAEFEDKTDERNYVTRSLSRRFVLPRDVDISSVHSRLSSHGLLTICAPKKGIAGGRSEERVIPVKLV